MLRTILSVSGKPGLYKLISQGKNMLILEALDATKKRFPAYGHDKVISLGDIAMYTDDEEVALAEVLESVKTKENGAVASIDYKKASQAELHAYMAEVLPTYDRDRFYVSHMKKVVEWYNALKNYASLDFVNPEEEQEAAEQE